MIMIELLKKKLTLKNNYNQLLKKININKYN